jgi:hypothetical protein
MFRLIGSLATMAWRVLGTRTEMVSGYGRFLQIRVYWISTPSEVTRFQPVPAVVQWTNNHTPQGWTTNSMLWNVTRGAGLRGILWNRLCQEMWGCELPSIALARVQRRALLNAAMDIRNPLEAISFMTSLETIIICKKKEVSLPVFYMDFLFPRRNYMFSP